MSAADHIVGRTSWATLDDLRTELILMKGPAGGRLLRALEECAQLDADQFARDVDRRADVRRQGWELVRARRHHLRGDGRAAVIMVRDALELGLWHP